MKRVGLLLVAMGAVLVLTVLLPLHSVTPVLAAHEAAVPPPLQVTEPAQRNALRWNSFFGSPARDSGSAIAVDAEGNTYITGTWNIGSGQQIDQDDAFVAKFDSAGVLLWHILLGGDSPDGAGDIAVDAAGNVYVTGYSRATWGSPIRPFTYWDAFVAKLNSSGELIWNTFLGSDCVNYGSGIAVGGDGSIYVAGNVGGVSWGAPIRPIAGDLDAFVAKLDGSGALQWNTFLGSAAYDVCRGLALDAGGQPLIVGYSVSTWGSPVRGFAGGWADTFAASVGADGHLLWNTFLGGGGTDLGLGIAVGGTAAYLAGVSESSWGSPLRPFSTAPGGARDCFVAKLGADGSVDWNTFLGSTSHDYCGGITAGADGSVYLTGGSGSSWGDPFRPHAGLSDVFVSMLGGDGALRWNSFLGSENIDSSDIAVAPSGDSYVAGTAYGTWYYPVHAFSGGEDAFVAKLGEPSNTILVNSANPPGGVLMTIAPADRHGLGDGISPCAREYDDSPVVTITAPAVAKGNSFDSWLGCDEASGATCTVTAVGQRGVTAAYKTPRILAITSSNPASGIAVTVTPADRTGSADGTTPFSRVYDEWTEVTLTAPAAAGANYFGRWMGCDRSDGATCIVSLGANRTITAVYRTSMRFRSVATQDGWVLESGETSGRGGWSNASAATLRVGDDSGDRQYRAILSFNTSALPDNAVISMARLSFRARGVLGANPLGTHGRLVGDIIRGTFSGSAALQAADFQSTPDVRAGIPLFLEQPDSWHSGVLSTAVRSLVNRRGPTQFRLRFARDDNDDGDADYLSIFSGNSVPANRPALEVLYEVP